MTEAQLQVVIDSIFSVIESKESGMVLALTKALQLSIDANLPAILSVVQGKLGGG